MGGRRRRIIFLQTGEHLISFVPPNGSAGFHAYSGERHLENFVILQDGIIAKYHIQVMLLFVYNRSRDIFGKVTHKTPLVVTVRKTSASVCILNMQVLHYYVLELC